MKNINLVNLLKYLENVGIHYLEIDTHSHIGNF